MTQFTQLKDLKSTLSPMSYLSLIIPANTCYYLLLSPTLSQFLLYILLEFLTIPLIILFDLKVFGKIYPDTKSYFGGFEEKYLKSLSTDQAASLLRSFMKYPSQRANFTTINSFLKASPSILYITFGWDHPTRTNLEQLSIVIGIVLISCSYFHYAVYTESHIFLSSKVKQLFNQFESFQQATLKVELPLRRGEFKKRFYFSIAGLFIFSLILSFVLFSTDMTEMNSITGLGKMTLVFFTCGIMCCQLINLNSRHIEDGFLSAIEHLENLNLDSPQIMPIHTSETLSQFQVRTNDFILKMQKQISENRKWMNEVAKKSRYEGVGEATSFLMHDLSSPVHIYINVLHQIEKKNPGQVTPEQFAMLQKANERIYGLVEAMRAKMKNINSPIVEYNLKSAINEATVFLLASNKQNGLMKNHFCIDPRLEDIHLLSHRVDAVHIFNNLLQNSVENIISANIDIPKISIKINGSFKDNDQYVNILFQDNGTGLSNSEFERLTGDENDNTSMGLFLTRKMIENLSGNIECLDMEYGGTTYLITLPCRHISQPKRAKDTGVIPLFT